MPRKEQRNKKVAAVRTNILAGGATYDNVVVKPISIENDSGIIKPNQYEDKPEFGEVIMVGKGRIFDNGTVVPLEVKVGDVVYFEKYSSVKFRQGGEDYLIIREEDIKVIIRR